jgi:GNAT superfamily N-acetyltransferase
MLSNGFTSVPSAKIATIVTCLEMLVPPAAGAPQPSAPERTRLVRMERPSLDRYRALYRKIGEDWLWFSRLRMPDAALAEIIHHPAVEISVLQVDGQDGGILELDYRETGQCEIAFFGVAADRIGHGLGGFLMRQAIDAAWAHPIQRLWVHTCTLDHPSALAFYRRSGFRPYLQQVEIADDPRLTGDVPRTAARHVPIFE